MRSIMNSFALILVSSALGAGCSATGQEPDEELENEASNDASPSRQDPPPLSSLPESIDSQTPDAGVSTPDGRSQPATPDAKVEVTFDVPLAPQTLGVGYNFACFLAGSKVLCGGGRDAGTFMEVALPAQALAVDVGVSSACAIVEGGDVYCWLTPPNNYGEPRGDLTAHKIAGLSRPARRLAAASDSACVVLSDGKVSCWGFLIKGGTRVAKPVAVAVNLPTQAIDVAVSMRSFDDPRGAGTNSRACAVTKHGRVMCWQLGIGEMINMTLPAQVDGVENVVDVAAGGTHACVATGTGELYCWGLNDFGQLGITGIASTETPRLVPGVRNARQVKLGAAHTCVLSATGSVDCFGRNKAGELGRGDETSLLTNSATPAPVLGMSAGITRLASGLYLNCAGSDTAVFCWGHNSNFLSRSRNIQFGNSPTPLPVTFPP